MFCLSRYALPLRPVSPRLWLPVTSVRCEQDGPNKDISVTDIQRGSYAAQTPGLELGLVLTSVNGQRVRKWAYEDVMDAILDTARPVRRPLAPPPPAAIRCAI